MDAQHIDLWLLLSPFILVVNKKNEKRVLKTNFDTLNLAPPQKFALTLWQTLHKKLENLR